MSSAGMRGRIFRLAKTRPSPLTPPFRQFPYRFVAGIHTVPKLNDPSLLINKAFVNGAFVDASSGKSFEATDPSTGKSIGTCPEFNKSDTEAAIAAAEEALKTWRKKSGRERATLLRAWYDEMQKNAADIATLITWEVCCTALQRT